MPTEGRSHISFKNHQTQMPVPYVIPSLQYFSVLSDILVKIELCIPLESE